VGVILLSSSNCGEGEGTQRTPQHLSSNSLPLKLKDNNSLEFPISEATSHTTSKKARCRKVEDSAVTWGEGGHLTSTCKAEVAKGRSTCGRQNGFDTLFVNSTSIDLSID
jgi:hypothetical protein